MAKVYAESLLAMFIHRLGRLLPARASPKKKSADIFCPLVNFIQESDLALSMLHEVVIIVAKNNGIIFLLNELVLFKDFLPRVSRSLEVLIASDENKNENDKTKEDFCLHCTKLRHA